MNVPFTRPTLTGNEIQIISDSIKLGGFSGDGIFSKKCESILSKEYLNHRALLVHSCTAALEMSALLIGIQPGDEVIMPSFTFVSTANAFALRGAKVVFVDIDPRTLNMDANLLQDAITPKTKSVCVVHYAGIGADLDSIMEICKANSIDLVEDAAQCVGSYYKGKPLGTFGRFGTLSFHATKNIQSGEGGCLILNKPEDCLRAEMIREKGTNRSQFLRGEVDKYTWREVGSSYVMSDLLSAFLLAQLNQIEKLTADRLKIWNQYQRELQPLEQKGYVRLPYVPQDCQQHNGHIFYMLFTSEENKHQYMKYMSSNGVQTTSHFVPLHLSPIGKSLTSYQNLNVTEQVAKQLVRLPIWNGMVDEQELVIELTKKYFKM